MPREPGHRNAAPAPVYVIPNDFIQTLLDRVDIVEVVDRYVPLKKAGANWVACCPFHGEKTPSFTVSPTKQFYPPIRPALFPLRSAFHSLHRNPR